MVPCVQFGSLSRVRYQFYLFTNISNICVDKIVVSVYVRVRELECERSV